jgi:hypothetical protein
MHFPFHELAALQQLCRHALHGAAPNNGGLPLSWRSPKESAVFIMFPSCSNSDSPHWESGLEEIEEEAKDSAKGRKRR